MKKKKDKAFTLVEVLICIGIIGIIAAITIPALLVSTSEKALEAQRKALYSRMTQAIGQIKNLKSYERTSSAGADSGSALDFIINGLSEVYKISAICKPDSLGQCGIPDKIYDYWSDSESPHEFSLSSANALSKLNSELNISDWGGLDTSVAGFKTANGESILLYYNPKCKSKKETSHPLVYSVCLNMIYDLNGRTGQPNAYGEDIGVITVFYPTDPNVVMPVMYHGEDGVFAAGSYQDMLAKATEKGLISPTQEELVSILLNKNLTHITKNLDATKFFWSSSYSTGDTSKAWAASLGNGLTQKTVSGAGSDSLQYFLLKK